MKLIYSAATACVAASMILALPASALPLTPGPGIAKENSLIVPVRGCHRDVERHFIPEIGRRADHYHRGSRCRPVIVEEDRRGRRDCHPDVQRHYLPEFGGRVVHRHSRSCRVIPMRRYDGRPPRGGACIQIGPIRYCE